MQSKKIRDIVIVAVAPQAGGLTQPLRPTGEVAEFLGNVGKVVQKCVDCMPSRADFILQHCAASS